MEAEAGINAVARAAMRAQTQKQIGLAIPVFNVTNHSLLNQNNGFKESNR
jgi:hypothetical protein